MATRFHYALPIARELVLSARDRALGGLATRLPPVGRPFFIVTGAGRSGTSAVARVLHESGISMGNEFNPPSDFNEVGFYEDLQVRVLNEQMITELGIADFWRSHRWPWRSTVLAVGRHYQDQMQDAASKARDGWKDPQFGLTLEAWLPHMPARPKVIVCLRTPDAYVDSVARRYGLVDREAMRQRWVQQYRRLLSVIRDYDLEATCVEYDALVEDPAPVVAALEAFVGRALRAEYVEPGLRRFRHAVPPAYQALYEEVLSLGGPGAPARALASAPPSESAPPTEPSARLAPDAYLHALEAIEARVQEARASWMERTGLPDLVVERHQRLGLTREEAAARAREASREYAAVLASAQRELADLHPPPGFEAAHSLTREAVDYELLMAEVLRAAVEQDAPDRRMLRALKRAWRRFGSEAATAKLRRQREEALARALAASKEGARAQ